MPGPGDAMTPVPAVQVAMAVYKPDMAALRRQVASILDQQGCAVRLTLFADGPMPQLPALEALVGEDERLALVAFPENRGAAATFMEGLAHLAAQPDAPGHFAFADQDDVWDADKLALSLERLAATGADAVHADCRVAGPTLEPIAPSVFALERRNLTPSLTELFFRNNATGMTMVMDAALARQAAALRHLRPQGWLHDHLVAVLAAAGRGLAVLDRPVVSYIQHGANEVGARAPSARLTASGGFMRAGGHADRYLTQGAALIAAILESDWPAAAACGCRRKPIWMR